MMVIEPRGVISRRMQVAIPVISALVALALAALPLTFAGAPVLPAYREMFTGVFGSMFSFTEMLTRATPLIFTGLAAALAFKARLWNIGAEGQLYLGAMGAVAVGSG
ncbi:MAG TPA: ABC transporter permease, partial [Aliiroseovarius sp.]|nr:ABC transporter permease [Aliiroseovarius sp.]